MATSITKDLAHINENLDQVVYKVHNGETPFTDSIKKEKVTAVNTEWLVQEMNTVNKANKAAENAVFAVSEMKNPVRRQNYTQIFTKRFGASGTAQAVDTAGGNELSRLSVDAGMDLKLDIEWALLSGLGSVAGDNGEARQLAGAEAWIKTNANQGTGASTPGYSAGIVGSVVRSTVANQRALTEDMFRATMQQIWTAGGRSKKVFVGGDIKSKISTTFGNNYSQKQQQAKDTTVYGVTDIYRGDFGTVDIVASLQVEPTSLLFVDPDKFTIGQLRKMAAKVLHNDRDGDEKAVVTEITLISKNERGSGKITDVK